jgi:hypothetical protein
LRDAAPGPELVRAMLDAGGEAMLGVPGYTKRLPLHRAAERCSTGPAAAEIKALLRAATRGRARERAAGLFRAAHTRRP